VDPVCPAASCTTVTASISDPDDSKYVSYIIIIIIIIIIILKVVVVRVYGICVLLAVSFILAGWYAVKATVSPVT
jgi:hypothetical protein